MALYVGDGEYRKSPNIRFYADIVYTNHAPSRCLPWLWRSTGILAG